MHKPLAPLLAALVLAGCASGPDYRAPEPKLDAAFVQTAGTGEPVAAFWKAFNDPALDALIAQAMAANEWMSRLGRYNLAAGITAVLAGALLHYGGL